MTSETSPQKNPPLNACGRPDCPPSGDWPGKPGGKAFPRRGILLLAGTLILLFIGHLASNLYMMNRHLDYVMVNDGWEYLAGARSFAENGTFMTGEERYYEAHRTRDIPEAYRPPLIAFLTGLILAVVRDPLVAAAVFSALCATLLALAVWWAGYRLGGVWGGLTAAAIVTFHPVFLSYALRYSSEGLFFLMLAVFLLAWTCPERPWKYAAMGAAAGLACGARPTALLLLPAFAVFQLIRCAGSKWMGEEASAPGMKRALLDYVVYAAAFVLVISPFCIRNRMNYGTWNPSGCLGGYNMFVGNNRDNARAYRAPTGKEFLELQNQGVDRAIAFAKSLPADLSPVEQDRLFLEAAKEEIDSLGAAEFCRLTAAKAWHFLRPWPMRGAHSEAVFWMITLSEILLFACGAAGVVLMRKNRTFLLLLLMILCTGLFPHSIVHVQMRHRVPFLDLPLVLLAAVTVGTVIRSLFCAGKPARRDD
jgi:hypothetical protein